MNPYLIGGAALIILILSWQLKSSYERNGELEAKLKTQVEQTQEAADANDTNMVTITTLKDRIATMIEDRRVDTERREQILVEREADLMRANAEADRLRGERKDEQLENADCAALAQLDVGSFCPATANQLRERSRGPGSHEDRDST